MVKSQDDCYEVLNGEWKKTCKILFGREVGELGKYGKWLEKDKQPKLKRTGADGKEIVFPSTDYEDCQNIASESGGLVGFVSSSAISPLNINEIKDIDSIISAIRERMVYSGNTIFGNSGFIESSAAVSNSFYILESARVNDSKYIAYSTVVKSSSNLFGCNVSSFASHAIRCHQQGKGSRNFEVCLCWNSSDCYYSYDIIGCSDCIFSFNLKGKTNCIGNLELDREKYTKLKKQLLEQIADCLEQGKEALGLIDIVNKTGNKKISVRKLAYSTVHPLQKTEDIIPIKKSFVSTYSVVFGKPPMSCLEDYAPWLKQRVIGINETESALDSGKISIPGYENFKAMRKDRFVSIDEAARMGEMLKLNEEEVNHINLENASEILGQIVVLAAGDQDGHVINVIGSPIAISSINCLSVLGCVNLKNSAYSVWPNGSNNVFGSSFLFNSEFCIKCHQSFLLSRCFEVDSSSSCSDLYFSHNCENVHNSMFCFNTKNLHNAIGNQQFQPDQYKSIKSTILEQLHSELESKKHLKIDIFSLRPLYSGGSDKYFKKGIKDVEKWK